MGMFKQITAGYKEAKEAREASEAGRQHTSRIAPIAAYTVIYKGGLPEYLQDRSGAIDMELFQDRIEFLPTIGTKSWFKGLMIPISAVADLQIVERTVSTFEGIFGGLNSRQLNQANNIHVAFKSNSGINLTLRVEMISGITVMGQAKKCRELMDRLKTSRIAEHFQSESKVAATQETPIDIPAQIEKLAALLEKNILTREEFDAKKAQLLSRM